MFGVFFVVGVDICVTRILGFENWDRRSRCITPTVDPEDSSYGNHFLKRYSEENFAYRILLVAKNFLLNGLMLHCVICNTPFAP